MLRAEYKTKFIKDVDRAIKRGKHIQKMKDLIALLLKGKPLAENMMIILFMVTMLVIENAKLSLIGL